MNIHNPVIYLPNRLITKSVLNNCLKRFVVKLIHKVLRKYAQVIKNIFVIKEILLDKLFFKRNLKILFSEKKDFEEGIKNGFLHTQHELQFGSLRNTDIQKYDLIVPLTIEDSLYLNKIRHLINNNPIPIPSKESILLCDNKYLFSKKLIEGGFKNFIPIINDRLEYPYIFKKKTDEWGRSTHVIKDIEDEKKHEDILKSSKYFKQQLILGHREYATHIIIKNRKIIKTLNIEYLFESEMPIKGKDIPIYKKTSHCPYIEIFKSILIYINYEGLCCFNYKVINGRPLIMEINPRFGGSLTPFFFSFVRDIE